MEIRAMTYDRTGSVTLCRRRVRPQHRACYSEECNGRDCKHDQKRLWNQFRECPVNPWGRWRSHRHEDRISCYNCDSCRWYWTGGLLCRLAFARKAAHACRRPIGYSVSRVRGSVLASVRWLTAWINSKTHWRRCLSNGSRPCSAERSARRILGHSPRARKASRPARNAATQLPHIRALASIRSSFCRIEGENSFAASAYAATTRPEFPILEPLRHAGTRQRCLFMGEERKSSVCN